jgi:hypothetical protein
MAVEAIACRCELSRQPFRGTSRNSDCHSLKSPACSVSLDQGSWGWVSAIDSNGRTIFVADAHRGDGKRYVAHDDEKLTTFLELESAIRAVSLQNPNDPRSLYSSSIGDSSAIQCPVFPSNQTLFTT